MKSALKLFIAVFFILAVIRNLDAQTTSIGGKVRYADDNQIVTSGVVKVYETNGSLVGIVPISSEGDWILAAVRYYGNYDVIGIADDDWEEDALPTGFPDRVEQEDYIPVYVTPDMLAVDIYIQRATSLFRPGITSNISGTILAGNVPVSDAMIFAKQGEEYYGYAITDSKGHYTIKDIPVGSYTLVAGKVGCISSRETVNLTEEGLNNLTFTIAPKGTSITNNIPNKYNLSQNYPNPFNPSTVINYSVPAASSVKLSVYSTDGKLVKELVNSVQEAGSYNVTFEASSLSSGIYFYTLSANGFNETRKMILVK